MKRLMHPMNRMALFTVLALQGAAFGLVAPDAHATNWDYTIVDGPGCSNLGCSTGVTATGATAALLSEDDATGYAVPLYARSTSLASYVYDGADTGYRTGTCNGTDPFGISSIDTISSYFSPGGLFDGYDTTIAYTDLVGDLYASSPSTSGPGAGSMILQSSCFTSGAVGLPVFANYTGAPGGTTYVAYEVNGQIFLQWYASSGTEWEPSAGNPCTTLGEHAAGGGGTDVTDPALAVYDDGSALKLWLFYHDKTHHCIRGQYTTDPQSGTWTPITGGTNHCIDGGGTDDTGFSATTLVDGNNQRLFVFYEDSGGSRLRTSFFDNIAGVWTTETVDGSVTISSPASHQVGKMIAPVWNPGASAAQVYYIDSTNGAMKHTTRGASSWPSGNIVVTDGKSCTPSNCDSMHNMDGPISAVIRSTCASGTGDQPHVFYQNADTEALREAFVQ